MMSLRNWTLLWVTVTQAFQNLMLHKLRSFLTMLGTLLGVASVISMLAIGEGSKHKAIEQIRSLGASNVIVRTVKPKEAIIPQDDSVNNPPMMQEKKIRIRQYGLTYKDLDLLTGTIPGLKKAVPIAVRRVSAQAGRLRMRSCRVLGTTPDFLELRNFKLRRGRFITWPDLETTKNVCVLAAGAARQLFSYRDPIGKKVLLGTRAFDVVGVLRRQASGNATPGAARQDDLNNDIYVPLSALQRRVGETTQIGATEFERVELSEITLSLEDERHVKPTAAMVRTLLRRNHPKADDFEIQVPLELLEQADAERRLWNLVLGAIAGISLLVGGIGIMNIMLATVTERTREIGLRRALGAKRADIILQFLAESTALSAIGGLLGIALGIAIPLVVTRIFNMQVIFSSWSIILAFGISLIVGIGFGVYPARRAAMLDPIEALRHD